MKKTLQKLFDHKTLERAEAKDILLSISDGNYNEHEVTAFVTVFLMRSITIDELEGFREALLQLAVRVSFNGYSTMDIVGTGGDGKNTFNISTLASFIVAGAGYKVTKHGNYGASSVCGSSNVMEKLGYRFKVDQDQLNKELEQANICFLHAPLFHPALKKVAAIRKNLGVRTFFNMLGPLVNPASPNCMLLGVYNMEMARLYKYVLQGDQKKYTIIHGLDGYDEISLTGDTRVITAAGEKTFSAEQLGKRMVSASDISGGNSIEEAAAVFTRLLKGEGTWAQHAVVLANAAKALYTTGDFKKYEDAFAAAIESLETGQAYDVFQKLIKLQHEPA